MKHYCIIFIMNVYPGEGSSVEEEGARENCNSVNVNALFSSGNILTNMYLMQCVL